MNILYLYTEVMGYQISVFRILTKMYGASVHVVQWTSKKLTPYQPPEIEGVHYYDRSKHTAWDILKLAQNVRPELVYISGWQDKGYLLTAAYFRWCGTPVVVGFDDQWVGSGRQLFASLLGKIGLFRALYSHAWVAGAFQTEYARRLGFAKSRIIFNLLACDISLFWRRRPKRVDYKSCIVSRAFLYVGNFRNIKGTDILGEAFRIYRNELGGTWRLICVGNGPLENFLRQIDGVSVEPFTKPENLFHFGCESDVFVLPSRHDQWGVALQEFSLLGMPLIASESVGSASAFLINGFNGYFFANNSARELAKAMRTISSLPDQERRKMGMRSRRLGMAITPELSAASLISILVP